MEYARSFGRKVVSLINVVRHKIYGSAKAVVTYAVFGRRNRSKLVNLAIALEGSFHKAQQACSSAGYILLEANLNVECTKVVATITCLDPVAAPPKTFEFVVDKEAKNLGYRIFSYELGDVGPAVKEVKMKLDVNGWEQIIYWNMEDEKVQISISAPITGNNVNIGNGNLTSAGSGNRNFASQGRGPRLETRRLECREQDGKDSGVESSDEDEPVLLSLGIELDDGQKSDMIKLNTAIPVTETANFTTANDDQTSVVFKVYEGERPMAKDNHYLGELQLLDVPAGPRGRESFQVTAEINLKGDLNLTAKCVSTQRSKRVTIDYKRLRSNKQLANQKIIDALQHRDEDETEKNRVLAWRNLKDRAHVLKWKMLEGGNVETKLMTEKAKGEVKEICQDEIEWIWLNKDKEKCVYEARMEKLDDFYKEKRATPAPAKMFPTFADRYCRSFASIYKTLLSP